MFRHRSSAQEQRPEEWEGLEIQDFPGGDQAIQEMAQLLDARPRRRPWGRILLLILLLATLIALIYAHYWRQSARTRTQDQGAKTSQTQTSPSQTEAVSAKQSATEYWSQALRARENNQFYEAARLLLLIREDEQAEPQLRGEALVMLREIYSQDLQLLVAAPGYSALVRPDGSVLEHGFMGDAAAWKASESGLERLPVISLALAEDTLFRLYATGVVDYQSLSERPERWAPVKEWVSVTSIRATEGLVAGLTAGGQVLVAGPSLDELTASQVAEWMEIRHLALAPGVIAGVDRYGQVLLAGPRASAYQELDREAVDFLSLNRNYGLAYTKDGRTVFSNRPNWLPEDLELTSPLQFLAQDEQLYALDEQGLVQAWDVNTDGQLSLEGLPRTLALAASSQHLLTLGEDGRIAARGAQFDSGKRVYVQFSDEELGGLPLLRRLDGN